MGHELTAEPTPRATIAQIVEALSIAGSTWNRADVMRALCDAQRPLPTMSATRWAEVLERACDTVIGTCVELDPTDAAVPRRASDGRSLWLEPTAPHITSEHVLAEEEYVVSWAIDAQTADPQPSAMVDRGGPDVLQADVAAVAGYDPLVLAVGPAGTGKTTTLRAAAADLDRQGRDVFGVAPSAKAARVLQRQTGIASDTLAKLLYEWERDDRAPLDRYRLPAGTTVIVDEAGMVGTGALARLVTLADQHDWRLALIGDHRQLQAVGRGGLFHELCVTGRSIELTASTASSNHGKQPRPYNSDTATHEDSTPTSTTTGSSPTPSTTTSPESPTCGSTPPPDTAPRRSPPRPTNKSMPSTPPSKGRGSTPANSTMTGPQRSVEANASASATSWQHDTTTAT